MAHDIKSVFSFFRREFSPKGPIGSANLFSPEAQRYMTPTVLGTINGLFSLIKFGFSYCVSCLASIFSYFNHGYYGCLDDTACSTLTSFFSSYNDSTVALELTMVDGE